MICHPSVTSAGVVVFCGRLEREKASGLAVVFGP